jgi:hypothetical protein
MPSVNPIWLEGQKRRRQRHDWRRWIRHDAHRFMTPAGIAEEKRAREVDAAARHEAQVAAEQEALRQDFEHLRWLVADLKIDLAIRRLRVKYSADQPRSPKGNPDGGRWMKEGGGVGGKDPALGNARGEMTDIGAARRRSGISEAECDAQLKQDKFICNLVRSPICWAQAMERYGACLSGRPLPPLNF